MATGDWDNTHDLASELGAATSNGGDVAGGDAPQEDAAEGEPHQAAERAGPLQTFVFSATLTLPQKLRRRLRKGARCSLTHVWLFSDSCRFLCLWTALSFSQVMSRVVVVTGLHL